MGLFSSTLILLLLWLHQARPSDDESSCEGTDQEDIFGGNWCYGDDPKCGEPTWKNINKISILCETGKLQSPIDIPPQESLETSREAISLVKEDFKLNGFVLENPGNIFEIYPKMGQKRRYVHSAPYKAKYWFHSINIHWGKDGTEGSEHTVEGKAFAAEIHFLFVKNNYGNLSLALNDLETPNAVSVLCILVNEVAESPLLESLIDHMPKIRTPSKDKVPVEDELDLSVLFTGEKAYNYLGSLAIPPCLEDVEFIVMTDPVDLSKKFMDAMRSLTNKQGGSIFNNYRRARPVEGHQVKVAPVQYRSRECKRALRPR